MIYYYVFIMKERKAAMFFIYLIALAGNFWYGFRLSETTTVYGNPINGEWNEPIFLSSPRFDFNRNYKILPTSVQSDSRIEEIWNKNKAHDYPYHMMVYEHSNDHNNNILPILDLFLNFEVFNNHGTTPIIGDVYVLDDNQRIPSKKHLYQYPNNLNVKETVLENDSRVGQQHNSQNNQEENDGSNTTEPVVILGSPVIVPANELISEAMNNAVRSKMLAQKQCVQDCQSSSSYNPVCGTDNVTYFNSEKFSCARQCGIDISIAKLGICS